MQPNVFLSHAVADSEIAAELNRLLATGLGITGKQVFCSSLPGRTIPGGFNFVDHIGKSLKASKVIILLVTENYLDSQFCLAEVGAAWLSGKTVIPVIVHPINFSRLTATLSIKQAYKIDDDDHLNGLADDACETLGISVNNGQWGVEKKAFLKKLKPLIDAQKMPKKVDIADHERIKGELEYSEKEITELRVIISQKEALIAELKKAKNAGEVRKIELDQLQEMDGFLELCEAAKDLITNLPNAAQTGLFHEMRGESLPAPEFGYSDSDERWKEIRDAQKKNMISDELTLIDHPKIKKAREAVQELEEYMTENDAALRNLIEEDYEITFTLTDEDFWSQFLW